MADDKGKAITSDKIKLRGRAAFAKLDKPKPFEEGQEPRYELTTLVDPASKEGLESIKALLQTAANLAKEKWGFVPVAIKKLAHAFVPGTPAPDLNKVQKGDNIELAFYDGTEKADSSDNETYESFRGMLVVPAHQYVSKPKPRIVDRRREDVEPGDEQWPYSGCYVVTHVTLWTQTNKKNRIGVNLKGVQFDRDGEAFGGSSEMSNDEFDALGDDDEAAAGEGLSWDN